MLHQLYNILCERTDADTKVPIAIKVNDLIGISLLRLSPSLSASFLSRFCFALRAIPAVAVAGIAVQNIHILLFLLLKKI